MSVNNDLRIHMDVVKIYIDICSIYLYLFTKKNDKKYWLHIKKKNNL